MVRTTVADRLARAAPINQRALLSRQMAADYLSIGNTMFRQFEASGDIKGIEIGSGKEKRYRRSDLDDLVERIADKTTNIDKVKRNRSG
jgi:hypothetical protein